MVLGYNHRMTVSMKSWLKISIFVSCLGLLSACDKISDQGINIPTVSVDCQSTNCTAGASNGTHTGFAYITGSGCDNIDFDLQLSSSANLICNNNGCTGSFSQWSADGENRETIDSGSYSLCIYIDLVDEQDPLTGFDRAGNTKSVTEVLDLTDSADDVTVTNWADN